MPVIVGGWPTLRVTFISVGLPFVLTRKVVVSTVVGVPVIVPSELTVNPGGGVPAANVTIGFSTPVTGRVNRYGCPTEAFGAMTCGICAGTVRVAGSVVTDPASLVNTARYRLPLSAVAGELMP